MTTSRRCTGSSCEENSSDQPMFARKPTSAQALSLFKPRRQPGTAPRQTTRRRSCRSMRRIRACRALLARCSTCPSVRLIRSGAPSSPFSRARRTSSSRILRVFIAASAIAVVRSCRECRVASLGSMHRGAPLDATLPTRQPSLLLGAADDPSALTGSRCPQAPLGRRRSHGSGAARDRRSAF